MNLREPKKKRHVRLKLQSPFPIPVGDENEWVTYTAHLTDLGSCIIEPKEMTAIHSMGFFGKGSLSRAYPSFGKARYGAPPVVKNRQWIRRQEWLKQLKELGAESINNKNISLEDKKNEHSVSDPHTRTENTSELLKDQEKDSTPDIIELDTSLTTSKENKKDNMANERETIIDQVTLDSTEEDDVCVILSKDTDTQLEPKVLSNRETEQLYSFDNYELEQNKIYFQNNETGLEEKLLVLPDSDSESEDYLKEIKPRVECESFPIQESLHLTFEETFFLLYGLGCLNLINFDGTLLDINNAWRYFCKTDKNFLPKYVVYHYFRSKGWVVKPGLKYGGDFLLYKQGPPFYHASYIVIVDVVDADSLLRDPNKSMRTLTWSNLLGLDRLSETAAKEILFAQVLWPSSIARNSSPFTPDVLSEFSVRELLWRRWNPKHNKDVIDLEEDDEESC